MSTDAIRKRVDRLIQTAQKILSELSALEEPNTLHRVDAVLPSGRTEELLVQARDREEAVYRAARYAVLSHTQSTKRILYLGPAGGAVQSMGTRANWTEREDRARGTPATEVIRNYLAERPDHER